MNAVLCSIVGLFALLFASSCDIADNERYLVPQGFHGRVLILFDRTDGAVKEYDGRTRIYQIPETGVLKTQFAPNEGWHEIAKVLRVGEAEYEIPVILDSKNFDQANPYACCWSIGKFQKDAGSRQFTYEEFYVGTHEQIDFASNLAEREDLGEYTDP